MCARRIDSYELEEVILAGAEDGTPEEEKI